ncbi:unnamed protein product [Rotaria magnacalcarata]|uniref:ATP-binding cassette sub-family B member 6 n=2 Tax=Rotaria magnacalcarata TaxID=392030 RepID=A0A816FSK7_9BILA|nr:unnamed protein product [Rotaria magnacalcarata]CAF1665157.1 unnamed protein product [Rotaria magnacalcarata]CAF2062639.1 unnamed protein product [Rotaria magnacalcarata]CAF2071384.1 unnamed protein product [Rotaria magnacalcarata]CAF2264614.1 unnamed protein product [Rotaria magnacalcarata]
MFCSSNETSTGGGMIVWTENGFTLCFFDTLTTSILFGFIFIFGLIQFIFYKLYGFKIEREYIDSSVLYSIQVTLTVLLACEPTLLYATETTTLGKTKIASYTVFRCVLRTIAWLLSLIILRVERTKTMPTAQSRGHGLIILIFWCLSVLTEIFTLISYRSPFWFFQTIVQNKTSADEIHLVRFSYWIFRLIATVFIFSIGLRAPGVPRRRYAILLNRSHSQIEEEKEKENVWSKFFRHFKTLAPFIWPRRHYGLQFNISICILILLSGRLLSIEVPRYTKLITDELIQSSNGTTDTLFNLGARLRSPNTWPWRLVLVLMVVRFLQGAGGFGSGALSIVRSTLWTKVEQYTTRTLKIRVFSHLHDLSLSWHLSRKTGEVLRIVDRGTDSVDSLLNYVLFSIFPTIADIIIAIVYFVVQFNIWFGIIVFATMFTYLLITIFITEWRTKYKKEMNKLDNAMSATAVDSLLNFETVKYYGAEEYEVTQYHGAIEKYQKAEWVNQLTLQLLNFVQSILIGIGLTIGSLYCAWLVSAKHELTVGDYVLFGTYILQLYTPLNFFGTYYRLIQQAFIDMENMLDLLDIKPDVQDSPFAKDIVINNGMIEFDDVCFHYQPERPILKNISFNILPGQTLAIVGPSGAGKSTIVRLLFRFYDIQSGSIKIDGTDISNITQNSLRRSIGVVPQDTVLFNKDVLYNIRYGRVSATDREVENAARTAEMHDRINTFPEGYKTIVGERGLKLSGGEKQRVAIARTLLKAPTVVLLDEATSALDTFTERQIQSALRSVCEGRTTLIVAHRLSTISHADIIIVVSEGSIIERGSHDELLAKPDGTYAAMWKEQSTSYSDADKPTTTSDNIINAKAFHSTENQQNDDH